MVGDRWGALCGVMCFIHNRVGPSFQECLQSRVPFLQTSDIQIGIVSSARFLLVILVGRGCK